MLITVSILSSLNFVVFIGIIVYLKQLTKRVNQIEVAMLSLIAEWHAADKAYTDSLSETITLQGN